MADVRLMDNARTVLDETGRGHVRFGPTRPGESWSVQGVSVTVSETNGETTAKVYRGSPDPGTFISGTYDGANDSDNGLNELLWPGEVLTVEWTGGVPGAVAIAAYRGVLHTGR